MDNNLQNYADLGKDLMKRDGLWDTALTDLDSKMTDVDDELIDDNDKKKPSISKWIFVGIAVLAAMTIGYLIYANQTKMAPVPMAYYEDIPTSLVPNVRIAGGDSKTDLQKAVIAYGDKNYSEAESLLTPLAKNDKGDLAKLYLASIYITQNKNNEAATLLNEIQNEELNDYVVWNKAISLLSQNPKKAEALFLEIANDTGHFKSKKAQEVLKKEFGH